MSNCALAVGFDACTSSGSGIGSPLACESSCQMVASASASISSSAVSSAPPYTIWRATATRTVSTGSAPS